MVREVVPVLGGQAAAQLASRPAGASKLRVTLDRAGDLEAGRAQQADTLADLSVDRDHHLRREQAVVARLALRGVGDVVAEEVV